ncbi:MAG TPA: uL15 family ribosomal protein [Candidatus Paceibacterota bacterium]|nr:uL15 family ribosomal protein [Candidatus Paceibacterota bacterium]
MQIHTLTTEHKSKARMRIGRGGKRGTYSGKGQKGQNARSGRKFRPIIKELILKQPKRRGANFKSLEIKPALVNLSVIAKNYKSGEKVTPKSLVKKGLIRNVGKRNPHIKILGKADLTVKLVVEGCVCSTTAKEAILKAGGSLV